MRQNSFVLLLFAAVLVAFLWPGPVAGDAGALMTSAADLAVALVFFLQGLSLATRQMLAGRQPLRLHLFVLGWNFLLFPALVILLKAPASLLIGEQLSMGLWMLAILPTTIASATALTAAAGGAVPQAIFVSIFSNLLAILLVPLLALVYLASAGTIELSLMPVVSKLCWIVLLPMLLGQCLRRCFREQAIALSRRTRWMPQAAILYIVYLSFAQTVSDGLLATLSLSRLCGMLALVTLLLLIVSWGVWRSSKWIDLEPDQRVTVFFTASQKSIATGLPLLTTIFAAGSLPREVGLVLVPLLFYHPLQLLLGGLLVPRLRARSS